MSRKDEVEATALAKQVLGYFQGSTPISGNVPTSVGFVYHVPEERLRVYDVRKIIYDLSDTGSVVEISRANLRHWHDHCVRPNRRSAIWVNRQRPKTSRRCYR